MQADGVQVEGGLVFRFRDREVGEKILEKLKEMDSTFTFMHVCGTHQDTLVRFGLLEPLKEVGVDVRQGPGCPVCVTTQREIEECLALARSAKRIALFGDLLKVPGATGSLKAARSDGMKVDVVYSVDDAVQLARRSKEDVVFVGIGFETTTPSVAAAILSEPPENFYLLSCHRLIPPALEAIVKMGELRLDGLIEPGHVSTVIGSRPYQFLSEKYGIPQVIAGFEPLDMLMGIYMLACQVTKGESKVEIEYSRVVRPEGNRKAVETMEAVFTPMDVPWRGFPVIQKSGLALREEFSERDARKVFEDTLDPVWKTEYQEPPGCLCGEVLRGISYPHDCPLFGTACTPESPIGPCMVSAEGGCNIALKYVGLANRS